jgi:hypothetical protein
MALSISLWPSALSSFIMARRVGASIVTPLPTSSPSALRRVSASSKPSLPFVAEPEMNMSTRRRSANARSLSVSLGSLGGAKPTTV